ncbi:MAG: hypothetical protein AB1589_30860 [Cyanobacteriota bacterium]
MAKKKQPKRFSHKSKLDWKSRYGKGYSHTCRKAHKLSKQRCCVCLSRPSQEIHHAIYGQGDVPGVHVFPVCRSCHTKECHSSKNWMKDKTDPVRNNRNTEEFIQKLRFGFEQLKNGGKR